MVEGKKGFVKLHLAITREMHLANIANGIYPSLDPDLDPKLYIRPEDVPDFRDLKAILTKVGGPYGWHLRKEYNDPESIEIIKHKLAVPPARRFTFWSGQKQVGETIIANIEEDVGKIFAKAHDDKGSVNLSPELESKTVEIYKIGLYPQHTNRRWGGHFLAQTLTTLFNDSSQPEVVYLNTRDTNHRGVISFYTGLNMNVIHAHSCSNDLIAEEEYNRMNGPSPSTARPNGLEARIA